MVQFKKKIICNGLKNQTFLWRHVLVLIFFSIIAALIYSSAAHGPFIFDDITHIVENPSIHVQSLSMHTFTDLCLTSPTRPFSNISLALSYYVHGLNPFWFRAVNVMIHILGSVFLFFLLKITLRLTDPSGDTRLAGLMAFFAALIFLVHPVQTQAVSYIIKRKCCTAAMVYILCMLLYAQGRKAVRVRARLVLFISCAFVFFLALGLRENMMALPFFIILYEFFFFQDLNAKRWRFMPLVAATAFVFAGLALASLGFSLLEWLQYNYVFYDFTLSERVMTQFRVVVYYVTLFIFPHPSRLNKVYDFPVSHSFFDPPATILCMALIAICVGWAFFKAKKYRIVSFCILWFFGNLVIESSILPLEMVSEHRLYLPSMFISLLPVYFCFGVLGKKKAAALLCCLVLILGFWTFQRNRIWSNQDIMNMDCAAKSPELLWQKCFLTEGLFCQEKYTEAVPALKKLLALYLDTHESFIKRALLSEGKGDLGLAINHYEMARFIRKSYMKDGNKLIYALEQLGLADQANQWRKKLVSVNRKLSAAYKNLGLAMQKQGNANHVVHICMSILAIDPQDVEANITMGDLKGISGAILEAERYYQTALFRDPGLVRAHLGLGMVLANKDKETTKSVDHLKKAFQLLSSRTRTETAITYKAFLLKSPEDAGVLLSASQSPPVPRGGYVATFIGPVTLDSLVDIIDFHPYEDRFWWDAPPGDIQHKQQVGEKNVRSFQK